jgi:hypothetical protein
MRQLVGVQGKPSRTQRAFRVVIAKLRYFARNACVRRARHSLKPDSTELQAAFIAYRHSTFLIS